MALLCTDYKIILNVLSERLKGVLENTDSNRDLHYTREVMDNSFLFRDIIDVYKYGIFFTGPEEGFPQGGQLNISLFSVLRAFVSRWWEDSPSHAVPLLHTPVVN